jgi:hypothetical protein
MIKPSKFAGPTSFSWIPVFKKAKFYGRGKNMQDMLVCKFRF